MILIRIFYGFVIFGCSLVIRRRLSQISFEPDDGDEDNDLDEKIGEDISLAGCGAKSPFAFLLGEIDDE